MNKNKQLFPLKVLIHTNFLTTKKQTTKFSSANFQKNGKSKLYHIENSKIGNKQCIST